jgi:hypothetical protein
MFLHQSKAAYQLQHRLQRTAASPLRVIVGFQEVRENGEGVSPTSPLPLSQSVRSTLSPLRRGPSRMYGYKFRPAGLGITK